MTVFARVDNVLLEYVLRNLFTLQIGQQLNLGIIEKILREPLLGFSHALFMFFSNHLGRRNVYVTLHLGMIFHV